MDHPKVLTWEIFCTHIGLNRNSRWKIVKRDLQEFVLHPIEWWKCKLSLVKTETKGFGSCHSVEGRGTSLTSSTFRATVPAHDTSSLPRDLCYVGIKFCLIHVGCLSEEDFCRCLFWAPSSTHWQLSRFQQSGCVRLWKHKELLVKANNAKLQFIHWEKEVQQSAIDFVCNSSPFLLI